MESKKLDLSTYPTRWSEYVEQQRAKDMLLLAARSAKKRKQPLDHCLIAHPTPGIGKTALAVLTAQEMGTNVFVVSGQLHRDAARLMFAEMHDRDVLFYNEFHNVMSGGSARAEWLKQYLENGVIIGPRGAEPQPRITVIADTTDAHKIRPDILSRFLLQPPMTDYSAAGAAKIATLLGRKVLLNEDTGQALPALTGNNAKLLAEAAGRNPRAMKRLLVTLRDLYITDMMPKGYDIPMLLDMRGITPDGLDEMAQRYLLTLGGEFGGTAGGVTLGDRLAIPGGLNEVERTLMDKGYVTKTRTGRVLTQAGIRRYRELEAA